MLAVAVRWLVGAHAGDPRSVGVARIRRCAVLRPVVCVVRALLLSAAAAALIPRLIGMYSVAAAAAAAAAARVAGCGRVRPG